MRQFLSLLILLVFTFALVLPAEAQSRRRKKSRKPAILKPVRKVDLNNLDSQVIAKRAILVDGESGKVLWGRDPETPAYPASTTKIMTGLLLLEHTQPEDVIVAPKEIETIKESSMHLKPFERVRAKHMIYAIMLRSANDGCYATACHISGSLPAFVDLMNQRAEEIGCQNTTFRNANGLNNKEHKTSAHDLVLIAREAMKLPAFREVVATKRHKIERSINQKDLTMTNRNKMLWQDKTSDGVKTGWTIPSGSTYVGSVTRENYRVYTAILNSEDWKSDHKAMVNWAYRTYNRRKIADAGIITKERLGSGAESQGGIMEIRTRVYLLERRKLLRPSSVSFIKSADFEKTQNPSDSSPSSSKSPEKSDQIEGYETVGYWQVVDGDGFSQSIPVYRKENRNPILNAIKPKGGMFPLLWVPVAIAVGFGLTERSRRLKRLRKERRKQRLEEIRNEESGTESRS